MKFGGKCEMKCPVCHSDVRIDEICSDGCDRCINRGIKKVKHENRNKGNSAKGGTNGKTGIERRKSY